jgi:Rps23 Pro-64 3,4-dihydroxylase Tpa1-like proline 4-hydroxylase
MEEKLNEPVDDTVEPKDVTDMVSEALAKKTKKNKFLVNVMVKSLASKLVIAERDLEEEREVVKQTLCDLREVVRAQQQQMEEIMKKFQEAETVRAKQEEESKKRQADIDALIKTLMSMVPGCQATQ